MYSRKLFCWRDKISIFLVQVLILRVVLWPTVEMLPESCQQDLVVAGDLWFLQLRERRYMFWTVYSNDSLSSMDQTSLLENR